MRYLMLLLVLVSIFGYCAFLKKKWDVRIEFSPAIVSSGIVGILFVAGILNMMKITAYLVFIIGINPINIDNITLDFLKFSAESEISNIISPNNLIIT